jgi:hypothetical protein
MSSLTPVAGLVSHPVGEGLALARGGGERIFALNATARFLWEALSAGTPAAALAGRLAAAFAVDGETAARDVEAMLRLWQAEGLLAPAGRRLPLGLGELRAALTCAAPALDGPLASLLAPLTVLPGEAPAAEFLLDGAGDEHRLTRDGRLLQAGLNADAAIHRLAAALAALASARLPWRLALHAAAIGDGESCLLLPGESRSGKSTLTAALLADGRRCLLGDDLALLRPDDLAAQPLPLPLTLKAGSWAPLAALLPDLAAQPVRQRLGEPVRYWLPPAAQVARRPLPVRALVVPRFLPGAPARLQRLAPFDALARLVRAPAHLQAPIDAAGLGHLAGWIERLPAWRLTFGSPEQALPLLAGL